MKRFLALILAESICRAAAAPCNNHCSGHGNCALRVCYCWEGFTGADCSLRTCPRDHAWSDRAASSDDAHNPAECSNMGTCNRQTGQCSCRKGFEGRACSRLSCPNDCSKHGVCQDMSHFASVKDPGEGTVFAYDHAWDSDMIFGCNCDPDYYGPDCSLRHCPRGDDPLTGTNIDPSGVQVTEFQSFTCRATSGHFTLSFRGSTTEDIMATDTIHDVKIKLMALSTITGVSVESSGSTACSTIENKVQIEFKQQFGDVPLLVGDASALRHTQANMVKLVLAEERVGTKEDHYCADRGLCSHDSGVCDCFDTYSSSDGYASAGLRGDCGYPEISVTACPGELSCSGHGICQGYPTYTCECSDSWQGGDCSERACPLGKQWFGVPVGPQAAHSGLVPHLVECSAQGACDRDSGECVCTDLFEGAACERLRCPADPSSNGLSHACSGHGQCLTMDKLASEAKLLTTCDDEYCHHGDTTQYTYGAIPNNPLTWDADMMQGCLCDDGWQGYDCSLRTCPYGDDPHVPYEFVTNPPIATAQVNEIQTVKCIAGTGAFYLSFRTDQTARIRYDATAAEVEAALEAIATIGDVLVTTATLNVPVCSTGAGTSFTVEFFQPTDNVPLMQYSLDGVSSMSVTETARGTKEYKECSGRGLCDRAAGTCACFAGFASSDGQSGPGERPDCGYSKHFSGALGTG